MGRLPADDLPLSVSWSLCVIPITMMSQSLPADDSPLSVCWSLCVIPIAMMSQSLPADDTTMSVLIAVVSSSLGEQMTQP